MPAEVNRLASGRPAVRPRGRISAAVAIAALLFPSRFLLAQGAPISGTASVTLSTNPSSLAVGGVVQATLRVDLSGVTGVSPSGSSTAAVLGGYQVSVTFDKARLRLDSAAGGSSTGYTAAPTYTSPGVANANGSVTLVASQTSTTAPTGNVTVAVLTFTRHRSGNRVSGGEPLEPRQRLPARPSSRRSGLDPSDWRRLHRRGRWGSHSKRDADLDADSDLGSADGHEDAHPNGHSDSDFRSADFDAHSDLGSADGHEDGDPDTHTNRHPHADANGEPDADDHRRAANPHRLADQDRDVRPIDRDANLEPDTERDEDIRHAGRSHSDENGVAGGRDSDENGEPGSGDTDTDAHRDGRRPDSDADAHAGRARDHTDRRRSDADGD